MSTKTDDIQKLKYGEVKLVPDEQAIERYSRKSQVLKVTKLLKRS